jgi:hypothetical protein
VIPIKQTHKHLGLHIGNKLSFMEHVDYVVNSCFRKWYTLKRLYTNASSAVFYNYIKFIYLQLLNIVISLLFLQMNKLKKLNLYKEMLRNTYVLNLNIMTHFIIADLNFV